MIATLLLALSTPFLIGATNAGFDFEARVEAQTALAPPPPIMENGSVPRGPSPSSAIGFGLLIVVGCRGFAQRVRAGAGRVAGAGRGIAMHLVVVRMLGVLVPSIGVASLTNASEVASQP